MKHIIGTAAVATLACATPAHASPVLSADFEAAANVFSIDGGPIKSLSTRAYQDCCHVSGSDAALDNTIIAFGAGNVVNEGSMFTEIQTVADALYTLTFRAGAYGGGWTNLSYSVGGMGGTLDLLAVNDAVATWKTYAYSFIGTGSPTTLSFYSRGSEIDADAVLDDVSVTAAVPEPATWALMLVGFGAIGGALRRRQKVATRVRFA